METDDGFHESPNDFSTKHERRVQWRLQQYICEVFHVRGVVFGLFVEVRGKWSQHEHWRKKAHVHPVTDTTTAVNFFKWEKKVRTYVGDGSRMTRFTVMNPSALLSKLSNG